MAYTPEQRLKIVNTICERYVAGITIEDACKNLEREGGKGIAAKTFYEWVKESNECNDIYKKAKLEFTEAENERYLQRLRGSFWKMIDYHDGQKNKREVLVPDPENPDKPSIKQVIIDTKIDPPNAMLIIAGLNNLDPDFSPLKPIAEQTTDAHLDAALDVTNLYKDDKPKVSRSNQLKN